MFHRIALFKFAPTHENPTLVAECASRMRSALGQRGYDAQVGTPADEASAKSWDLSLVVVFRTRENALDFDPTSVVIRDGGLEPEAVAVVKTWVFEG